MGPHTHLALEGAALPEKGQSNTSESQAQLLHPGCLRVLGGLGLGAWGGGRKGPVVTPWAVGAGRGSYHLFHIIFLKIK